MARRKYRGPQARMEAVAPDAALTAAVRELEIAKPQRRAQIGQAARGWQSEAWARYDDVGELRFVCQWLQNSCSRVSLYAAELDEKGQPSRPSTNPLAVETVAGIAGGPAGQSDLMRQCATPLTIAGEFHIAILRDRKGTPDDGGVPRWEESWHVIPSSRVRTGPTGGVTIMLEGEEREIDPQHESVFQVLSPHPLDDQQPDSPVRAALPILREIRAMDMLIDSASKSRLAGNGLLLVPKEVNAPSAYAPTAGQVPGLPDSAKAPPPLARKIVRDMVETMKQSLEHTGEPEALTPITLSVPGDSIDKFRHMTFSHDITEQHQETRDRAIKRLSLSLDVPAEILMGLGDSTHWNAALVDEQASRQHIAPLLTIICDALTKVVLRPMMEAQGQDPNGVVVWFDMSPITQKTDRKEEATAAFEAGVLTREAYLRELGFGKDDLRAQDAAEMAMRMMERAPSLYVYLWSLVPGFPPPSQEAVALMRDLEGGGPTDAERITNELPGGEEDGTDTGTA